jgi:large subunit ribosomal protein L25
MKSVAMSGSLRANVGKKDAKALRVQGLVPCVLYGGKEQVVFSVTEKAFKPLVYTPDVHTVELNLDGTKHVAILKELQLHPVTDRIIHADFLEVGAGKPVTISLPVQFSGNSPGVRAGGKLIKKMRKIKVRGPIENLPDRITIDITTLELGQSIRTGQIDLKGLSLLDAPNLTVVSVNVTRNVAAPVEEAKKPASAAAPAAPAAKAAKK